jgi:hypothetical protein
MALRRWFRFHLSTAIVLMVVAWPLLAGFAVLTNRTARNYDVVTISGSEPCVETGWPLRYYDGPDDPESRLPQKWNYPALAFDLLLRLFALYIVGFVCEWLIYRPVRVLTAPGIEEAEGYVHLLKSHGIKAFLKEAANHSPPARSFEVWLAEACDFPRAKGILRNLPGA